MKVLVTGGTGFVGHGVIEALARAGHQVRALARPGSEGRLPQDLDLETAPGDVTEPQGLDRAAAGVEAVVHLVGIIREFKDRGITFERLHHQATRNVLAATRAAGVGRYLHMSALGARPDSVSAYHRTKAAAEAEVRASGLDWTIFRPSIIFGPRDLSLNTFAAQLRKSGLFPVIGSGQYRLQPVALETVAAGFAAALDRPAAVGQSFDVTGPEAFTFDELIRLLGRVLGVKVRLIHLPVGPVRLAARLLGWWARFPLTEPQLDMLLEGSAADGSAFYKTLELTPIGLEDGLKAYLK